MFVVDSGAPAPDFPIGSACCLQQRACSASGGTLEGQALGHHGTPPALAMSGAFSVTPHVTACTASGGKPVLDAAGGLLIPRHRPPSGASRPAPPPPPAPPWASGARRRLAPPARCRT